MMPFKPPSVERMPGSNAPARCHYLALGFFAVVRHITLFPICTASSYERQLCCP
ncbi:hypothetical protein V8C35DRAFT_306234 [Trichoderma chlorosporum]